MEEVYKNSSLNKFTVVSTFAGGGGSSTGYKLAGGNVLAMNEFVEEAQKTYHKNYPETPIMPGDIKELTGKDFLDKIGLEPGELDILDGSPPCSAFSMAGSVSRGGGKHSDGWGQTKKYSDGKKVENIEDLFFEFLRVANEIRPKVIIAENVAGLDMGEAKNYKTKILETFEEIGYSTTYKVLDSSNYGVPQTRKRIIFIGVRNDVMNKIELTDVSALKDRFPNESFVRYNLGDAFENLEYDQSELSDLFEETKKGSHYLTLLEMNKGEKRYKIPFKHLETHKAEKGLVERLDKKGNVEVVMKPWFKVLPSNKDDPKIKEMMLLHCRDSKGSGTYEKNYNKIQPIKGIDPDKVLTGCDFHDKGHHFNMKRVSRHQPCPTITATGGLYHWSEMRKLTLGELKRAMSLPDDFVLTGKWKQKAERIGRMVPPRMTQAIAESVYEKILKPYKELQNG